MVSTPFLRYRRGSLRGSDLPYDSENDDDDDAHSCAPHASCLDAEHVVETDQERDVVGKKVSMVFAACTVSPCPGDHGAGDGVLPVEEMLNDLTQLNIDKVSSSEKGDEGTQPKILPPMTAKRRAYFEKFVRACEGRYGGGAVGVASAE